VRAPDHAAPARDAAGALRPGAAEERVRHGHARLAEEHADARLGVARVGADLAPVLVQQPVGRVVGDDLGHAEHPLGLRVVRRQRGLPVVQLGPLAVFVEAPWRAVERVRVAERAATDARAGDHRHVAERREPEDPAHPEPRRVEVAAQVPRRARQVVVAEAPPALEHRDPVALLAQPQRGDAAAEAGADDQPVVVVVMHGPQA
jgi:hypothetical protein